MFTIFHLLQLVGLVGGIVVGIIVGGSRFGIIGAVVGSALGLLLGLIVGRVPWLLAWAYMRHDLRRSSSEALRRRVGKEYFIAHLLIAELAARGESIDDLRPVVEQQLAADSKDVRRFAEHTARIWFPDLVGPG